MWTLPSADRDTHRVERFSRHMAGGRRRVLIGHKKAVDALAWNYTGTRLASGSRDQTIRVWHIDTKKEIGIAANAPAGTHNNSDYVELKGHSDDVCRMSWCPMAGHADLIASCSMDKSVKLWDTKPGANPALLFSLATLGVNLHLKWSPCGRWLILLNQQNLVSLIAFDPLTRKLQVTKSMGFNLDVNDVEWSRDSERVMLGHMTGSVEVLAVPALTKLSTIPAHPTTIFALQLDPKGKYLATGAADSLVHLWDSEELVCLRSFPRLDDSIRTLSFSHDSQLIAYGGKDCKIEIADVESGARVHMINIQDETLSVAFHPSSLLLAYSTVDKVRGGGDVQLINCIPLPVQPSASSSSAAAAAATPSQHAKSSGTAGSVKVEKSDSRSASSSSQTGGVGRSAGNASATTAGNSSARSDRRSAVTAGLNAMTD